MKITELPGHWEKKKAESKPGQEYSLRLPLEDAARIAALAELYPERSEADILNDMISAALDDLVATGPLKDRIRQEK